MVGSERPNVRSTQRLCHNPQRRCEFEQHIGALLFICTAVGELDGHKAVSFIKPARAGVLLKRVQPNGEKRCCESVGEKH